MARTFACLALVAAALAGGASSQLLPFNGTITDAIRANPQMSILSSLLDMTGLGFALTATGPFTFYAPIDSAFTSMDPYLYAYVTNPANSYYLMQLLGYHIALGNTTISELYPNQVFMSASGDPFYVEYVEHSRNLGLADVTCNNEIQFVFLEYQTNNGLLQAIDTVMVPHGMTCDNRLYWTELSGQERVGDMGYECRSSGFSKLVANQTMPSGVAVDPVLQLMFWTNDAPGVGQGTINVANTDGSGVSTVLNASSPRGIDIDIVSHRLYFVETGTASLMASGYDGSGLTTLATFSASYQALDVAVDSDLNIAFVTLTTPTPSTNGLLQSVNLGSGAVTTVVSGLADPTGVCIDDMLKMVFYLESITGALSCYAYSTTPCPTKLVYPNFTLPFDCTVDNQMSLYGAPINIIVSSQDAEGQIWSVRNDGTHLTPIASLIDKPAGLAMGCLFLESPLAIPFKVAAYDFSQSIQNVVKDVLDVLTPGATYDWTPYTSVDVTPDQVVSCPVALVDYVDFVTGFFGAFSLEMSQVGAGAMKGGDAMGAAISQGVPEMFASAAFKLGSANATMSGGGGVGFGFTLQCDGNVIFTYGGGGGGGYGPGDAYGLGGGGGCQTVVGPAMSIGGGGGCGCTLEDGCSQCSSNPDANSNGTLYDFANALSSILAVCPIGDLAVCGSGGGGGGWSTASCEYGSGFSVLFNSTVILPPLDRDFTAEEKEKLKDLPPAKCSANADDSATAEAVNTCNQLCVYAADFNSCFCPCFKGLILQAGLPWGMAINCPGS